MLVWEALIPNYLLLERLYNACTIYKLTLASFKVDVQHSFPTSTGDCEYSTQYTVTVISCEQNCRRYQLRI